LSGLPRLGLLVGGTQPPDGMIELCRTAEDLGYADVWVAEDCFFTGGIGAMGAILGATSRVRVGTGIVSAFTRHPAVAALDFATLGSLFPGRVIAGLGFGLHAWLDQMGVRPDQMRGPLRETVRHFRDLLAGREVDAAGPPFRYEHIQLAYPPAHPPSIVLGVAGPRLLELSGEVADGTLLGANSSPAYVRWACERVAAGAQGRPHEIACLAFLAIDPDRRRALDAVRPVIAGYLAMGGTNPMTDALGISGRLDAILAEGGGAMEVAAALTDEDVSRLAVAGDPDDCLAALRALGDAGAHAVALFPQPTHQASAALELLAKAAMAAG
jgi:alkanesulfonate monooxygenase SsuD/methylene tetrahydromethanopterin reductase-like flavin-dependent oxidoreductase (luciferase family)